MKLDVQRIQPLHAKARWEALSDYRVASGVFIDWPISMERTREWCESVGGRPDRVDFCLEANGTAACFSGLVNISHEHGTAELYTFLHPDFFGKGIGSAALSKVLLIAKCEMGLRKVSLYVSEGNEKAISFYERNGFELEGKLKKHVWFRGRYQDRYIYSHFLENVDKSCDELYERLT